MKKILNSFIFVIFAALAFNACSDVPAPYDIPGTGGDSETEEGVYIDETFRTSLGSFTSISAQGNLSWKIDFQSACITGFQDYDGDGQKENQAGITYLVSPTIDLSASTGAYITFDHALEYERGSISDNNQLVISKDYAGDVNTANWEVLPISYDGVNNGAGSGSDGFNFESAGNIDIPAAYIGEGNTAITVALRHTCDDSFSSTWEVQNFKMAEGTGEDTDNPDNPDNPEGGTAEDPYTVAEAQSIIANGSYTNDKVYVKGIISQIDEVAPDFGNATYHISDDGSTNGQLEVYRGYYLGGEKFTSADQIKVGDEVIVYGALTLYVNQYGETPEISTGSQIYSLNGTTSEVGGGEQGGSGTDSETGDFPETGPGSQDEPYDVATAMANQNSEWAYVTGYIVGSVKSDDSISKIESNDDVVFGEGGTAVRATMVLIADDPAVTDYTQCLAVNLPSGGSVRSGINLQDNPGNLGKKLTIGGKLRTYFNIPGLRDMNKDASFTLE